MQLASPALPVGAYSYSQGLEYAVERGWLSDAQQTLDWLRGLLGHSQTYWDIPVFARLFQAWTIHDEGAVGDWNQRLFASRESREIQQQDSHLGTALARLLYELNLAEAGPWRRAERACFATLFTLASVRWQIELHNAASAYIWTWAEQQVAAATKLIPLGQTASQRILCALQPEIATAVERGLPLGDDDIGRCAPGLALASALHETQYSRLFRS